MPWCILDGVSSDTASYELEQPLHAVVAASQNMLGADSETCDHEAAGNVDNVADRPLANFVSSVELADETVGDAEKPAVNSEEASAATRQNTVKRTNSHVSLLSDNT